MDLLYELVREKSVLIIDVYDILLVHLYRNQDDLFRTLELDCKICGFYEARKNAQQYLAEHSDRCGDADDLLNVVYGMMPRNYQSVKEKEVRLNILSTKVNSDAKKLYEYVVAENIPIYLCDQCGILGIHTEEVLKTYGYTGYKKLFTPSGQNGLEEMYLEIMRDTSVEACKILHIRSNADFTAANGVGVSAFEYEPLFRKYGQNMNSAYFAALNKHKEDSAIPVLQSGIALYGASDDGSDDWKSFGYKYIGILAFEYAKYIGNIISGLGIKKVFFSSANGYCLKSAFESIFPQIEAEILFSPKRSLILSVARSDRELVTVLLGYIGAETTFHSWISLLCPSQSGPLYEDFIVRFPDQNRIIFSEYDFEQLRNFIIDHKQLLLDEAARERNVLNSYMKSVGVFEAPSAVVDISSDMELLHGLASICCDLPLTQDLTAFYWEYTPNVKWKFSLINQLKKEADLGKKTIKTRSYLERILSLVLSEPNEIVVALKKEDNGTILPEHICQNQEIQGSRIALSRQVIMGAVACVNDLCEVDKEFPFALQQDGAMAVCEYFEKDIDKKDCAQLGQISFSINPYDWQEARPLFRQEKPVIGIANPWPQDVSAEAEVITRMKRTAEENNVGCVLIDNFGHILNDKQGVTKKFVKEEDLSFIITTHYECAKVLDVFYYNPLWNPPEIPLNLSDYATRVTNQFMMNDDFLIYDDGGMSNHLRAVLMNCPRTLEGASSLTASFPASAAMAPKLDKPVMFYCGMNWEIMFAGPGRHEGLFKLLDDTGKAKFYGPERVEAWGGLKPWEGYRCYEGMIPFDGFSIVEKINECGICLVLSSDTHRRAGAATNRLYEACAAGAVIISDDNDFVLKHFGDAALFIRYNKSDPIDTFNQIMEKYDWIVKHPDEALQLARRAQEIYLKEYSLDAQIKRIIQNHPNRLKQLSQDLYAQKQEGKVLVTFVLNTQKIETAKKWLVNVIRNLHGQIYANLELGIAADVSLATDLAAYCDVHCACAHVVPLELFDIKGVRKMTDGEAIRELQKRIRHDYYINTTAEECWFFDHITSLVRAVVQENCMGAYSGAAFESSDKCRRINFFDVLNTNYLYRMTGVDHPLVAGQFLFRADAHNFLPDYLFGNLDGKEQIAYAGILLYRQGVKLAFTKRMSLCHSEMHGDKRCTVLSNIMQERFICDLIRFYVPEEAVALRPADTTPISGVDKKNITEMFLYLPLKVYIRLRYYRFRMRGKSPSSKTYKKYAAKYDACYEQYRQYWSV